MQHGKETMSRREYFQRINETIKGHGTHVEDLEEICAGNAVVWKKLKKK